MSYREGIAGIESGGNYGALGPYTKGDRPYGKYQVMGANVGPWTQRALGRRLSTSEFLADPAAQDATFDHIFGGYVQKYGERGAAEAWFGGPGAVGKRGRKDVLGTSVGSYGDMFLGGKGSGAAPASQQAMQQQQQQPAPGPSSYMQSIMGMGQQQHGGGSQFLQTGTSDALIADLFAGRNPLRQLVMQKVMSLFV